MTPFLKANSFPSAAFLFYIFCILLWQVLLLLRKGWSLEASLTPLTFKKEGEVVTSPHQIIDGGLVSNYLFYGGKIKANLIVP